MGSFYIGCQADLAPLSNTGIEKSNKPGLICPFLNDFLYGFIRPRDTDGRHLSADYGQF